MNNPVAKHLHKTSRPYTMKDRKKEQKLCPKKGDVKEVLQ